MENNIKICKYILIHFFIKLIFKKQIKKNLTLNFLMLKNQKKKNIKNIKEIKKVEK